MFWGTIYINGILCIIAVCYDQQSIQNAYYLGQEEVFLGWKYVVQLMI